MRKAFGKSKRQLSSFRHGYQKFADLPAIRGELDLRNPEKQSGGLCQRGQPPPG